MPAPRRILRVGVVVGTTIVEERLVRDREPVRIGEHVVLRADRDGYRFCLAAGMEGRLADGGPARVVAGPAELALSDHARGKVCVGDTTVLFQLVSEPPAQPRPTLPASVRGTFADRIDRRLAAIVAGSLVVHFGLAIAAWMHDRPVDRSTRGARAEQMTPDMLAMADPEWFEPDPVPADPDDGEPAAAAQPAAPEPARSTPAPSTHTTRRPVETDAATLQEEAARYAAALAASGESDDGIGEMDDTAPGGDLAKQMKEAQASNAKVELGGNGERGPRDDYVPREGTVDEPDLDGPDGPKTTPKKTETSPKARIDLSKPKGFDETTLSPESVRKRILDVYMTGLQRCQKDLLLDDPTARARVELSFTVNESGRLTSPDARSDYKKLDLCIEQRMAGWTFPAPEDEDGEKTEASFGLTLALQPE